MTQQRCERSLDMREREPKTRFLAVEELRRQLALASDDNDDSDTGLFDPTASETCGTPADSPRRPARSERTATIVEAMGAAGIRAQAARRAAKSPKREEPLAEPARRPTAALRMPAVGGERPAPQQSAMERLLANRPIAIAGLVTAAVIAVLATIALSSDDDAASAAPTYAQAAVAPLVAASEHQAVEPNAPSHVVTESTTRNEQGRAGSHAPPTLPPAGKGSINVLGASGTCEQPKQKVGQNAGSAGHDEEMEVDPPDAISARLAVDLLLAGRRREALDAYRGLSLEPGAPPELSVVASLLENELRDCAPGDESCVH